MGRSILCLGGSKQQIVAIEKAKKLGLRVVLCDYLLDNPGQYSADVYYPISTTDREAVLEVAKYEKVEGIISYASDPAAATAAYVAEQLGLPTNPLDAVLVMSNKHLFRRHLKKIDLPSPSAVEIRVDQSVSMIHENLQGLKWPLVIKPTDSSGSKGVSVIQSYSELATGLDLAASFSRNGIIICEEFIKKSFPFVIGGDIFVVNGRVVFWGLMSCLRDDHVALLPIGERSPTGLDGVQYKRIKKDLQALVTSLNVRSGELNVEVMIGPNNTPYIIELGPRAGGNMLPIQLSDMSSIDLVSANIKCAMGDLVLMPEWTSDYDCEGVFSTYVIHSLSSGYLKRVNISEELEPYVYRIVMYSNPGDKIEIFDGANKAVGILFIKFDSVIQMEEMLTKLNSLVRVELEDDGSL